VISQFTLYGRRLARTPARFHGPAPPALAKPLYEAFFASLLQEPGTGGRTGEFGALIGSGSVNEGPRYSLGSTPSPLAASQKSPVPRGLG